MTYSPQGDFCGLFLQQRITMMKISTPITIASTITTMVNEISPTVKLPEEEKHSLNLMLLKLTLHLLHHYKNINYTDLQKRAGVR